MRKDRADTSGRTICIYSAVTISRDESTLVLVKKKDDKKHRLPVESVSHILIYGDADISKPAIELCSDQDIVVSFFSYYGWFRGAFMPNQATDTPGKLLVEQVKALDNGKGLIIAKSWVECQLLAMAKNLKQKNQNNIASDITHLITKLNNVKDIDALRPIEGAARKHYYRGLDAFLPAGMQLEGRHYHAPTNPMNALVSFLNGKLYATILNEIRKTGLNPSIGFYHVPQTSNYRYPMVYDIADLFKPSVDRIIIKMITRKEIKPGDFSKTKFQLKESALKTTGDMIEEGFKSSYGYITNDDPCSLHYAIRTEVYRLIKHLLFQAPYQPLKKSTPCM